MGIVEIDMKIVIFTMGTRGDVQPYIYLAKALIKADRCNK
jgi:UDP:flavonoid glycosyltransferase YjiC (YdhE family)